MAVFKRDGYWWIDFYDEDGERRRKKVGRSKKIAQDTLEEVKTQVRQRKLGIAEPRSSRPISVRDFFRKDCFEYFDSDLSEGTAKRYKSVLRHFLHFLRTFPKVKLVSQVQPRHIEKYKAYRKTVPFPKGLAIFELPDTELKEILGRARDNGGEVAKDNTVNFELATLRSVFNLAIRWKYLSQNPVKGVRFRTVTDAKKPRFLTQEEVAQLLEHSFGEINLVFRTLVMTGMRSGELINLEWGDVDFKRRIIRIRIKENWQPKRRHERDIPIHEELLPLLKGHKRRKGRRGECVFCNGDGRQYSENKLRRELAKAARRAGLRDLTKVHSLRHTFGSQLVLSGVDLPTVRDLMGHKDIETTMIYIHRTQDHMAKSVNRLRVG